MTLKKPKPGDPLESRVIRDVVERVETLSPEGSNEQIGLPSHTVNHQIYKLTEEIKCPWIAADGVTGDVPYAENCILVVLSHNADDHSESNISERVYFPCADTDADLSGYQLSDKFIAHFNQQSGRWESPNNCCPLAEGSSSGEDLVECLYSVRWAKAVSDWEEMGLSGSSSGECCPTDPGVWCKSCNCDGTNPHGDPFWVILKRSNGNDPAIFTGNVIGWVYDENCCRICATDYMDLQIGTIVMWNPDAENARGLREGWRLCDNSANIDFQEAVTDDGCIPRYPDVGEAVGTHEKMSNIFDDLANVRVSDPGPWPQCVQARGCPIAASSGEDLFLADIAEQRTMVAVYFIERYR